MSSETAALKLAGRPSARVTVAQVARVLGALTLIAVGVDHLDQYLADSYSTIPTIGTLFALNFAGAVPLGLGLLAPLPRSLRRWSPRLRGALAVGGLGLAGGSLVGLLVSENGGLFGFVEQGYRPAIVLSIVLELATVGLLTAYLAFRR
jgi:hypothetical protein